MSGNMAEGAKSESKSDYKSDYNSWCQENPLFGSCIQICPGPLATRCSNYSYDWCGNPSVGTVPNMVKSLSKTGPQTVSSNYAIATAHYIDQVSSK